MKKYFYLAAVSAMMLTACSSDKDVLEPTPTPSTPTVVAQQQAVAFDTYLAGTTASTRAGDPTGVMTTDKLKTSGKGFGVFAFYTDDATYPVPTNSTYAPNFMFNEHVYWANGWTYSPLKYWPNETTKDSQSPNAGAPELDKISFFAYAPYVSTGSGTLSTKTDDYLAIDNTSSNNIDAWTGSQASGIMAISRETASYDPLVEWKATPITTAADLDGQVDLLWGVAPNGMAYQSVNPDVYVNKEFGFPLWDMVKPNKDQKIKFLFQHALSRIGLSVVSAIDQITPGDDAGKFKPNQTRVLIKSVEVFGDFGTQGVLNLNNDYKNKARWIEESLTKADVDGSASYIFNVAEGAIAKDLRYEGVDDVTGAGNAGAAATAFAALNPGVLSSEQPLLAQGADPSKLATGDALKYAFGKTLYTLDGKDYVRATTTATAQANVFTKDATDNYTQVAKSTDANITLNGTTQYFTLALTPKTVDKTAADPSDYTTELTNGQVYYAKAGTEAGGDAIYTKFIADGSEATGTYYVVAETEVEGNDYSGTCYTGLVPRYFMVIPTGPTPVKIRINYAVVTYDEKLNDYVSDVENIITKQISVNLESGKSYNLKLILGLTSVKLDATVADWLVADDSEIFLPKNNE